MSQTFTAASKSTSIAWTVLGVSTRAFATRGRQERDLGARAVGQRGLDLGAEQVVGQGPGRLGMRREPLMTASVLGMNSVPSSSGFRSG